MRILNELNQYEDVLTDDDNSSVGSDDSWMTVYNYETDFFGDFCDEPALQQYSNFRFFQCWGGGPYGGYISNGKDLYRVNKTLGSPWEVEPINGVLISMDRPYGGERIRVALAAH